MIELESGRHGHGDWDWAEVAGLSSDEIMLEYDP
jgi:hypothetical protein